MRHEPEDLSAYPGLAGAEHLWFENDGLELHAVAMGHGPLLVLLHGFPEYWYCWRYQITALSRHYRVLALDLRGFNTSQAPAHNGAHAMAVLARDVHALIHADGRDKAVLIAHDWGGYVGWHAALLDPRTIRGLVTLNVPSPNAMGNALRDHPEQQAAAAYVRVLADEHAYLNIDPRDLFRHLPLDSQDQELYRRAYERSGLQGPLGYYRMAASTGGRALIDLPGPIDCPVLALHGENDPYVLQISYAGSSGLTHSEYRFELLGDAGHFLPREQPERVNRLIREQLNEWNY